MKYGLALRWAKYVRGIPVKMWDFSLAVKRNGVCAISPRPAIFGVDQCVPLSEVLEISQREANWLIPPAGNHYAHTYGNKKLSKVTRNQVASRIEKLVRWKLQREHKWKQYEYSVHGQRVTDKRGVTV